MKKGKWSHSLGSTNNVVKIRRTGTLFICPQNKVCGYAFPLSKGTGLALMLREKKKNVDDIFMLLKIRVRFFFLMK